LREPKPWSGTAAGREPACTKTIAFADKAPGGSDWGASVISASQYARTSSSRQGPSDELLTCAAFAPNEYRGAGGGDCLRFLEDPTEGGALPDEFAEVVLGADLLLQVGVLFGELVLQRLYLLEGDGVLDGHGYLVGNKLQEACVGRLVGERLLAGEEQDAQPPPSCAERQMAGTLDPIPLRSFEGPRPALFLGHVREDLRLLFLPDPPCRLVFKRKNWRGLAERRGVRSRYYAPLLQRREILAWARAHRRGTRTWPTARSGRRISTIWRWPPSTMRPSAQRCRCTKTAWSTA